MKQKPRRILLRKLLLRASGKRRLWPALVALFMGTVLLLYAIIMWTGFRDILSGRYDKGSIDATFLTLGKQIPADESLAEQTKPTFNSKEIRALKSIPVVEDLGMFTAGRFPVEVALTGDNTKFSTSLFLEAVPERFIDDKPLNWEWRFATRTVPVIVSTEFLNLYNFGYAPNQGVPQLTQGTIKALSFTLTIGDSIDKEEYTAKVVGFSDRISSILVPQEFIQYGNERFAANPEQTQPSRLVLRVKDPSDNLLVEYFKEAGYVTNREMLRWNRLRLVIYTAAAGMGLLAAILLFMGVSVFALFIRLTLAHAKHNLLLLVQIGYSPRFLTRFMYIRYLFIILAVMIAAGAAAIIAQVRTAKYILPMNLHIATFPAWEVWAALGSITLIILLWVNWVIVRGVR